MNAVIYYSNAGETRRVAEYMSDVLGYPLYDVFRVGNTEYENAVLCFPVYCQNAPRRVLDFLDGLSVRNLTLIATYGKMSYGNVLNDIQRTYSHNIVSAAYFPTKHAYVDEPELSRERLHEHDAVAEKLGSPSTVVIPRSGRNPLSCIFPTARSRIGVRIVRDKACNGCGICDSVCRYGTMRNGKPGRRCIRCMRCVSSCPNGALTYRLRLPMRMYLGKKKRDETVIYV